MGVLKRYITTAVILAAGSGSRMNVTKTKQTLDICGKSVMRRTLEAFDSASCVDSIVLVCKSDEVQFAYSEIEGLNKTIKIIVGGKCRAESAKLGFLATPEDTEFVMIHDCARCLVTLEDINSVAEAAYLYGAATASTKVTDTVKKCDNSGMIATTVPRDGLRAVQTPQAFSCELYARALALPDILYDTVTDDNMLMEKIGIPVFCVDTEKTNIKITTLSDIDLAEFILSKRECH